ncbi:hypothetical protein Ancab_001559 [Ancistrocladus abbreviatus]
MESNQASSSKAKLAFDTTPREPEEIERVFRFIDEDGDGMISPAELRSCMRKVGGGQEQLSMAEAEAVVESSDSDGDGLLNLEEFKRLMVGDGRVSEAERDKELREAFEMYAMEGSGCITPKSLKRMMSRLGESSSTKDCESMIRKCDLNGDGVLSFEEFAAMMR